MDSLENLIYCQVMAFISLWSNGKGLINRLARLAAFCAYLRGHSFHFCKCSVYPSTKHSPLGSGLFLLDKIKRFFFTLVPVSITPEVNNIHSNRLLTQAIQGTQLLTRGIDSLARFENIALYLPLEYIPILPRSPFVL